MGTKEDNVLTESQLMCILIGSMTGIGVLSLPGDVIKISKQDGWISVFLGAVYPIYMVFIANYIRKKYPKADILDINKKIYGRFFGSIFNLIFLLSFLLAATEVAAGINNVLRIYMVPFLNRWNILTVLFLITAYAAYGGIKTIGRINEVLFYGTFIVYIIPLFAISKGNILNLKPIFGSGALNIIKGLKETVVAYAGIEVLFIIYPFAGMDINIKKCGLKSIAFTSTIYTLFTIVTILYLGIDATSIFLWPLVTVTESIMIPVINSFRYIFSSLWVMNMFRVISINYYTFSYGLNKFIKKFDRKAWVIILFPIMIILSTLYGSPTTRRDFLNMIFLPHVIYNVMLVTITAILVAFRKGDDYAKKDENSNND
ncbi:Spore germination protein YndE [Clostridium liquoris]|mgnify:CR=1 FL=1|jgi:spore germination protein (amino acid permease)|uniref:Spore germination protein YndE n=1 Tax=Clostridium liquoris TaxID=1289519 RepID=A0A2T0B641_9CLOT|nr:GerAB/ArcD/ProY family transporter [Clostridium liquoris]PRR79364.1 Spore germination protein YndE [Clostridium liquoris]